MNAQQIKHMLAHRYTDVNITDIGKIIKCLDYCLNEDSSNFFGSKKVDEIKNVTHFTFGLHGKNNFSFVVPTDTELCEYFCQRICFKRKTEPTLKVRNEFVIMDSKLFQSKVKKALKFVSKDILRPAMTGVLLKFENDTCTVVAIEAHRLIECEPLECIGNGDISIIIDYNTAKSFASVKAQNLPESTHINVYNKKRISINGQMGTLIDARFPDYKAILPNKLDMESVTVNRATLASHIKAAIPFANKTTNQVKLHFNGKVEVMSSDIDFSYESKTEFDYERSEIEELTIVFNGKMLLDLLANDNDKNVTLMFYHRSYKYNRVLIADTDTMLLCPLMVD